MSIYTVEMHHTQESFTALSKMQYDQFCQSNKVIRAFISFGLLVFAVSHLNEWWSYLIVIYAIYLTSSTRMTATRAARKLVEQIEKSGVDYPASRLRFESGALHVISLPEKDGNDETVLHYNEVCRLCEDADYYYIFRDRFGGYMVPKAELKDRAEAFRDFLEKKTGKPCYSGASPLLRTLAVWRKGRDAK